MLISFLFVYSLSLIAGSWILVDGIQNAPLGYEDEEGFHLVGSEPGLD